MNQFIPKSGGMPTGTTNKLNRKFIQGMDTLSIYEQLAILDKLTRGKTVTRNGVMGHLPQAVR